MKRNGFTLVELLVVISIIAILSVVGITIFSGAQKTARDARRRSDIEEIAKAMEINYAKVTSNSYSSLCQVKSGFDCIQWFNGGLIPKDPINSGNNQYGWCEATDATGSPPSCASINTLSEGALNRARWMVCARLENGTRFCKTNMY